MWAAVASTPFVHTVPATVWQLEELPVDGHFDGRTTMSVVPVAVVVTGGTSALPLSAAGRFPGTVVHPTARTAAPRTSQTGAFTVSLIARMMGPPLERIWSVWSEKRLPPVLSSAHPSIDPQERQGPIGPAGPDTPPSSGDHRPLLAASTPRLPLFSRLKRDALGNVSVRIARSRGHDRGRAWSRRAAAGTGGGAAGGAAQARAAHERGPRPRGRRGRAQGRRAGPLTTRPELRGGGRARRDADAGRDEEARLPPHQRRRRQVARG